MRLAPPLVMRFYKFQNICVKKEKLENASEDDVIEVDVVRLSPVMLTLEPAAASVTWCHGFKTTSIFKPLCEEMKISQRTI